VIRFDQGMDRFYKGTDCLKRQCRRRFYQGMGPYAQSRGRFGQGMGRFDLIIGRFDQGMSRFDLCIGQGKDFF